MHPQYVYLLPSCHLNPTHSDYAMWQSITFKSVQPHVDICHDPRTQNSANQMVPRHHLPSLPQTRNPSLTFHHGSHHGSRRQLSCSTVADSPRRWRREESSTKFLNHCSCGTARSRIRAAPLFNILPETTNHNRSRFAPATDEPSSHGTTTAQIVAAAPSTMEALGTVAAANTDSTPPRKRNSSKQSITPTPSLPENGSRNHHHVAASWEKSVRVKP